MALPFRLYQSIPQWVPPLGDGERIKLSRRHPFYQHSEAAFFLAEDKSGIPVGRLAILNNKNYNQYNQEQTAFFTLFECVDDPETAQGLFLAAEAWAAQRGLCRLFGPKGFSALDGLGLLVRGFEHRPALGIPYNLPYYPALLDELGFQRSEEIYSGYLPGNLPLPEKIGLAAERVQARRGLRTRNFKTRKDLLALIPELDTVYNAAIAGTPGNVPLAKAEIQEMARQLLLFADPRLIKLIYKEDRPIGYLLAYPDVSAAIQRSRGKFFPFGWLNLLIELRRCEWININGAGIIEEYRGLGGTAVLFNEMQKSIAARKAKHVEVVQIGAENERMLNELRLLGVDFYKSHCIFSKWI